MLQGGRNIVRLLALCFALLAPGGVGLVGCDESLPPRDDPTNLLHAVLSIQGGEYVFRYTPPGGITPATVAIQIYNDYNEVFEDTLYLRGRVEIWDTRRQNVQGYVDVKNFAVVPSNAVNNGILTLEAGARLTFKQQWYHMVNQQGGSVPIWVGVDTTAYRDYFGEVYYLSDSLYLGAKASIQIFRHAAVVQTNVVYFTNVYKIYVPSDTGGTSSPAAGPGDAAPRRLSIERHSQ